MEQKLINWLLEGDQAIRYQVFRDLIKADHKTLAREQEKIILSGWGKELLDRQDPAGTWGNGLYSPKWISTFYTLLLFKQLGAPPVKTIISACRMLLNKGILDTGGISYWKSYKTGETCVTGMLLSMLCYFGIRDERNSLLLNFLAGEQMIDGGWNCEKIHGATHSSFHTTISVLEGLWEYKKMYPENEVKADSLSQKGMEFLLCHRLYKSHRTGETVNPQFTRFVFPSGWRYDMMRCLDFARVTDATKDERFDDAITVLKSRQTADGFWKAETVHQGKYFFKMEPAGERGRWNTLRALRILNWWEN